MSKKNARSWRLVVTSTALMVVAGILVLNVGASANVTGAGPIPQAQPSGSASASASPRPSSSPAPEDTCNPGPSPLCIPGEEEPSASASTGPSPSPSGSPNPGGGDTHSARISIDYNKKKDAFVGKVDSKAVCSKARRVDLFEVAPGKDQNRGHALTTNKSKYTIPFPKANGRFYTKARKSTPNRNTTCKGAESKKISV
jgi:hypothetical protein